MNELEVKIEEVFLKHRSEIKQNEDQYDKLTLTVKEIALDKGLAHLDTARAIDKIGEICGIPRGMFKDFILIKTSDMNEDIQNLNRNVSSKYSTMTTEQFFNKLSEFESKVECYATIEEFYYRTRGIKEGYLMLYMLEQAKSFTQEELDELVEKNPDDYKMTSDWMNLAYGVYIPNGWFMTVDKEDDIEKFTMYAIGWDGKNIPEGKIGYAAWKEKK